MWSRITKSLKRDFGCNIATQNFRFGNAGFDAVGYSSGDSIVEKPYGDYEQFWFGRKQFHFEVLLRKRKFIEVGIHLEGKRSDNVSMYRFFEKNRKIIKESLGECAEIALWGKNWRRVYEHLPRTDLTDEQVENVAGRMAKYIEVLQPMVESWESKHSTL